MLDFETIIAEKSGQRDTFEQLVCQIFRRMPPHAEAVYRRIHGAGGDGGVEAVWILPDKSEHGVQAKFYTKASRIDWSAIDKSVVTALTTHPTLTKIYIAIACPFTGATGRTTRSGKPARNAWDRWEERQAKWAANAASMGRKVTFEVWTASELEELLMGPECVGLKEYWFGEIGLSSDWLKAHAARTMAALDDRYHPEDHVNVDVRRVFDGLLRTDRFREKLAHARKELLDNAGLPAPPDSYPAEAAAQLGKLAGAFSEYRSETVALDSVDWTPWPFADWYSQGETLTKVVSDNLRLAREHGDTLRVAVVATDQQQVQTATPTEGSNGSAPMGLVLSPSAEHPDVTKARLLVDALSQLRIALGAFLELLASDERQAAESRFVFLDGRAGSGKSHLIASEVDRALAGGTPAIFLIGTDFALHSTIEQQVLSRLEINGTRFDALLGALDAAAEANGTRALIAFDAVNEGAGARLWRPNLEALAKRILAFPRLTLCVSCRREYVPQLLAKGAEALAAKVEVRGFETEEEMERAAQIYMDRRGIIRPATPRLNPEFSNPLFLRSTCVALERSGRREFPRGIRGTREVLAFFLDATARYLGTDYDGSTSLIVPTRRALLNFANEMAKCGRDFVEVADAHRIADAAFAGYAPPPGKTWVEVLRLRGLLRTDPNPALDPDDPLCTSPDVIAFSFQRFQDHLIVDARLSNEASPSGLFDPNGALEFILDGNRIRWRWRGAFYAAYVFLADRFGVELVDCLPGGAEAWWSDWEVQDAFVESVRWRSTGAFNDRTRECLNAIDRNLDQTIALLIELAIVSDHPWNANFLHANLLRRRLALRDAFWTIPINQAYEEQGHPAQKLIDWASRDSVATAEHKVLFLAAITLAWFCTSTNGELRDRATKALAAIILSKPEVSEEVLAAFATCDDLYVTERIAAALYGAALRTYDPAALRAFGEAAWRHVFKAGKPPLSMLCRDYARGVIELALAAGALGADVNVDHCRPPYGSSSPAFNVSQAKTDVRAKRLGAESITRSCYNGLADFGRYTVEGRVDRFAATRLTRARPEMAEESAARFLNDFADRPDVLFRIEQVRAAYRQRTTSLKPDTLVMMVPPADEQRITDAETHLAERLTAAEKKRYQREVQAWAQGRGGSSWRVTSAGNQGRLIDAAKAKVWIANRAMSLGWSATLFPSDRSLGEDRIRGSRTERIGKKYQRIAFGELLARLADNYWIAPEYGAPAKLYDNPLDVEFVRDIDPSILPSDLEQTPPATVPRLPPLQSDVLPAGKRETWAKEDGLAEKALRLAAGADLGSDEWIALYRYASCDIRWETDTRSFCEMPWQQSEFYFASLFLVPADDRERFVREAQLNKVDFHDWLARGEIDGAYLRELGRRAGTWNSEAWSELEARHAPVQSYRAIRGSVAYQWESHLDRSLPEGVHRSLPNPWLLAELNLKFTTHDLAVFADGTGSPLIFTGNDRHSDYAFIKRGALEHLCERHGLAPVLTVIGERTGVEQPTDRGRGVRVRYNGMMWFDAGLQHTCSWSKLD